MSLNNHAIVASLGAVAANVVPHLAHAIAGQPFPTPFTDPPGRADSPPKLNAVWAGMNAAVAGGLLFTQRHRLRQPSFWLVSGASGAVSAFGLAVYFRSLDHHLIPSRSLP
ncbi:hypothetical protein ACWDTI_23485 [Gordonia sp. NPDC003424]